jgi:hypothetical protein
MTPASKQKEIIHVSRHWDNPAITVAVHSDGIAIQITLEDLLRALAYEIDHPAFAMTRAGIEKRMLAAVGTVLNKVKESSAHI